MKINAVSTPIPLTGCHEKQAGNGPSRRPTQGSKEQSFLNMQNGTKVEILSILQCRKIPEGMRMPV